MPCSSCHQAARVKRPANEDGNSNRLLQSTNRPNRRGFLSRGEGIILNETAIRPTSFRPSGGFFSTATATGTGTGARVTRKNGQNFDSSRSSAKSGKGNKSRRKSSRKRGQVYRGGRANLKPGSAPHRAEVRVRQRGRDPIGGINIGRLRKEDNGYYYVGAPGSHFYGDIDDYFKYALGVNGGGQNGAFEGGPPVFCELPKASTKHTHGFHEHTFLKGENSRSARSSGKSGKGKGGKGKGGKGKGHGANYYIPSRGSHARRSGRFRGNAIQDAMTEVQCYYGAFPPFGGVPRNIRTSPSPTTLMPSLAPVPTTTPETGAPTMRATENANTRPPTSSPTLVAEITQAPTLSPTVAATIPDATIAPTTPAVVTAAPTASTFAPTIAPTGATSQPTAATAQPTSVTAQPTQQRPTIIPPEGTTGVLVESNLQYRFFDDEMAVPLRMPLQEEIDGLILQTNRFYLDSLRQNYTNLVDVQLDVLEWTYEENRTFPVFIDFDANVFFLDDTTIPPAADLLRVMQVGQDYEIYIMDYVWMSEPADSIFREVNEVLFKASVRPAK